MGWCPNGLRMFQIILDLFVFLVIFYGERFPWDEHHHHGIQESQIQDLQSNMEVYLPKGFTENDAGKFHII